MSNNIFDLIEVNPDSETPGSLAWWQAVTHKHNFALLGTYRNEHGELTTYSHDVYGYEPFDGETEGKPHQPCTWEYAGDGANEWPFDERTYTRRGAK